MDRDARTVLVVEDEPHIRDLVGLHLELEGWTPELIGDGHLALDWLRARPFDLVILDIMLPGLDGLTVLKALRRDSKNTDVPVLLLTARREESDKVLGLESGADDYLAKPFGVAELVARARALMRRPRASADPDAARGGRSTVRGLTVDPRSGASTVGGRDVDLTSHEFDLLLLLASHPGVVFSREAAARADLERRHLRHRAQRRRAGQAAAPEGREPIQVSPLTCSRSGARATSSPMSSTAWYRSLTGAPRWRFACLTGLLLAQAALFLWLAGRSDRPFLDHSPPRVLRLVALDMTTALEADSTIDPGAYLRDQFQRLPWHIFVVTADGKVTKNVDFSVPDETVHAAQALFAEMPVSAARASLRSPARAIRASPRQRPRDRRRGPRAGRDRR